MTRRDVTHFLDFPVWSASSSSSTSAHSGQCSEGRSRTSMPRNADRPHWSQIGERRICDASPQALDWSPTPLRIKHYRPRPTPLPVLGDIP